MKKIIAVIAIVCIFSAVLTAEVVQTDEFDYGNTAAITMSKEKEPETEKQTGEQPNEKTPEENPLQNANSPKYFYIEVSGGIGSGISLLRTNFDLEMGFRAKDLFFIGGGFEFFYVPFWYNTYGASAYSTFLFDFETKKSKVLQSVGLWFRGGLLLKNEGLRSDGYDLGRADRVWFTAGIGTNIVFKNYFFIKIWIDCGVLFLYPDLSVSIGGRF